jgi:hypothetical protein
MSSFEISDYQESPQEIYQRSKDRLRAACDDIVKEVFRRASELDDEFYRDIEGDIRNIRRSADRLVGEFTFDTFNSSGDKAARRLANALSSSALAVRQRIEQLKMERREVSERIAVQCRQCREVIAAFEASGMLVTYKKDYEMLKDELRTTEALSLMRKKDKNLLQLQNKLKSLLEVHEFAKNVNVADIKEDKFKLKNGKKAGHYVELEKLRDEICRYSEVIRTLDEELCGEMDCLLLETSSELHRQRLRLIRDQVKITYGNLKENIAWTKTYKDSLADLRNQLGGYEEAHTLIAKGETLEAKKYIERAEYLKLQNEMRSFISEAEERKLLAQRKSRFIERIKEHLNDLGYSVAEEEEISLTKDMEEGTAVFFNTAWDGYKIMSKINSGGELVTRVVRSVADNEQKQNITAYQRQKDIEIARHWCGDYDRLTEKLQRDGIKMTAKLRKEPEEEPVICIVDTKKKRQERATGKAHHIENRRDGK